MNSEQQASNLNILVKVKIAPSKIHGVGVFALRDIPLNAKLYLDKMPEVFNLPYSSFNKLFPEIKKFLLERWPQVLEGKKFIYPDGRLLSFVNHSDTPNYDFEKDETLTDIYEGEEVLMDYRKFKEYKKVYTWLAKKKMV